MSIEFYILLAAGLMAYIIGIGAYLAAVGGSKEDIGIAGIWPVVLVIALVASIVAGPPYFMFKMMKDDL